MNIDDRFDRDDVSDDEAYMLTERHAPRWNLPADCNSEFGPDHDHDNFECAQTLDYMRDPFGGFYDDGFAESYNRGLEEESLGRPLFPNEY